MQWIKANIRPPEHFKLVPVKIDGSYSIASRRYNTEDEDYFVDPTGDIWPYDQIEWLDESIQPSSTLSEMFDANADVTINDDLPDYKTMSKEVFERLPLQPVGKVGEVDARKIIQNTNEVQKGDTIITTSGSKGIVEYSGPMGTVGDITIDVVITTDGRRFIIPSAEIYKQPLPLPLTVLIDKWEKERDRNDNFTEISVNMNGKNKYYYAEKICEEILSDLNNIAIK